MVKISKQKQTEDEMKILTELQNNSKGSIDTIAKRCGLSKQKVWKVIKQLEKDRTIWGYTAIVNENKNNLVHFIMLIKRTGVSLDKKLMDRLESVKLEDFALPQEVNIESSCFVHGNYDWIISFTTLDLNHAKKFSNFLIESFPGIIEKIDLVQSLYFVRKQHIFNPDRKKIRDLMS